MIKSVSRLSKVALTEMNLLGDLIPDINQDRAVRRPGFLLFYCGTIWRVSRPHCFHLYLRRQD